MTSVIQCLGKLPCAGECRSRVRRRVAFGGDERGTKTGVERQLLVVPVLAVGHARQQLNPSTQMRNSLRYRRTLHRLLACFAPVP